MRISELEVSSWVFVYFHSMFQTGSEKRAAHGVSLFLVDADTPGFHKGRKLNKLGLKGQDTAELFFEDVRVPASALLGQVRQSYCRTSLSF